MRGHAVAQPRFSPDGSMLAWVSDATGWMQVWVATVDADGAVERRARPLLDEPHEHAEPSWGPGQRSYAWSPDSRSIALNRNEDGFGRLVVVDVASTDACASGRRAGTTASNGARRGSCACAAAGAPRRRSPCSTPQVTGAPVGVRSRAACPASSTPSTCPSPIRSRGRPTTAQPCTASSGDRSPHSDRAARRRRCSSTCTAGPTDQAVVGWAPRVRWFLSRGWAVLAPNPRGSTGYGRAYLRAADGGWGTVDVADTVAGIRALADRGEVDGARVGVMGGSAGGFTALLVGTATPPVVRAVVSLYGGDRPARPRGHDAPLRVALPRHAGGAVARVRRLATATARRCTARRRSPCPCSCCRATRTRWCRPRRRSASSTRCAAAGTPVEHHVYEGEGHGWSRPDTVTDALERIEAFLAKWVTT